MYDKNLLSNLETLPPRFYEPKFDILYKLNISREKEFWVIEYFEENTSDGLCFETRSIELLLAVQEMIKLLNSKGFKLLIFKE